MTIHAKMLRSIPKAKVTNGDIVTMSFVQENGLVEGKQWTRVSVPEPEPQPQPKPKAKQTNGSTTDK